MYQLLVLFALNQRGFSGSNYQPGGTQLAVVNLGYVRQWDPRLDRLTAQELHQALS